MDPARYLALFVEETSDHLDEFGRALLDLEKDPASAAALETCFRMAHSIKGMSGAMHFDAITALAHRLEDRLDGARNAGRVDPTEVLPKLFEGLDRLERLVFAVRDTGACPEEISSSEPVNEPVLLKKKVCRKAIAA